MIFDYWGANSLNVLSRIRQRDKLLVSFPTIPETFSEKIRYRMAFDRRPILQKFADKFHVRQYVEEVVGSQYLANIYDANSNPSKINWNKLPTNFVCKTNHGSGGMVGVWTGVEREAKLPSPSPKLGWTRWWVHPDNFDAGVCKDLMNIWLRQNYAYRSNAYPEWAYAAIPRTMYIEELLQNDNGTIASPYYFYIFNGQTQVILVSARDEQSNRYMGFVDNNWHQLNIGILEIDPVKELLPFPTSPSNLKEMIQVAQALAAGIDFARVDLYNVNGRIVFSEITNYPGAGQEPWVPQNFEHKMGSYWNLDVRTNH